MTCLDFQRQLVTAAREAGLSAAGSVDLGTGTPRVPVLLDVLPMRIVLMDLAAYGRPEPGETLEVRAAKAWAVAQPFIVGWHRCGLLVLPVNRHDALQRPAAVIARARETVSAILAVAQGLEAVA